MRHVEHDPGRRGAHGVDQRIERGLGEVIEPVEHRRRGEQMQVVAAFRQQPVDQGGVDAVGREHRLGDALRRVLVVVEPGGAEAEVEVGDDRGRAELGGEVPGEIVGDGRGADAALGADHRDDAAERLGAGRRNRCETALTKSTTLNGSTRYSLTPRAINCR